MASLDGKELRLKLQFGGIVVKGTPCNPNVAALPNPKEEVTGDPVVKALGL